MWKDKLENSMNRTEPLMNIRKYVFTYECKFSKQN